VGVDVDFDGGVHADAAEATDDLGGVGDLLGAEEELSKGGADFKNLKVWTEVLQDSFLDLFDSGNLDFAMQPRRRMISGELETCWERRRSLPAYCSQLS
jgi:hypothetical protein